jgi:hypothetical protein
MKGNQRFKAPNCRGGCVSRKFWGAHCLPAVRAGDGSTREGKMMKCRHQTNQSLITIHSLLDLELSKKASKFTQDSAHRNRNSETGDFGSEMLKV